MWIADTDRAEVLCFGFSPDGATLYTGDDEGAVFAWDRASQEGRELHRFPRAADGPASVWQVVPTPDGARLLVPNDGRVYELPAAGGGKPRVVATKLAGGTRVSLAADGTRFLGVTTARGKVGCWDVATGNPRAVPGELGKYTWCVWAAYLPGDATILTVGMDDPSLVFWDAATGERVGGCLPE